MERLISLTKQAELGLREMPPKRSPDKPLYGYAIANRRGPSVGKSAWKPGGVAHKTTLIEHATKNGTTLRWYVDNVTGRRVAPVLHDARMRSHLHAEKVQGMIRRLVAKAEQGGLTALELEKLALLAQDESVGGNHALAHLVEGVLTFRKPAGHVITCRNVPKTISGSRTLIRMRR